MQMEQERLIGDARFGRWFVRLYVNDFAEDKDFVKIYDTNTNKVNALVLVGKYHISSILEHDYPTLQMDMDIKELTIDEYELTRIKKWINDYFSLEKHWRA
jgi:hypothetical protein